MNQKTLEIEAKLLSLQDLKYKEFQASLLPTIEKETIIGIRMPILRTLAKEYINDKDIDQFLDDLPHHYYDENILHVLLLNQIKDNHKAMQRVQDFLPYVNNWAVCDAFSIPCCIKDYKAFHSFIKDCIISKKDYTMRFGIDMLMKYYLTDKFRPSDLKLVSSIKSKEYYINMAIAWYFATALALQWEDTLSYIENQRLSPWTHNKTIQKAVESYRIEESQKTYLKSFRLKGNQNNE